MPIIEDLEQGTDAWLEYRQSRVMATDISIIIGSNDFTLPLELWEMKLGLREPPKVNDAMLRGQTLEPEARALACLEIGLEFKPCVYESNACPWAAASLDGLCDINNIVLEIKCPKERIHLESFDGIIPPYYIDQMQWQMLMCGADLCYYFSYRPEYKQKPFNIIKIDADTDRQKNLFERGKEFYLNMCTMQPPKTWTLNLK